MFSSARKSAYAPLQFILLVYNVYFYIFLISEFNLDFINVFVQNQFKQIIEKLEIGTSLLFEQDNGEGCIEL